MMIVFPLLFTLLLAIFGRAEDHNKCSRNVCEIFQFLETESYGRMEFEKHIEMYAIDNNLQRGHKALKEVIEDLGASIHIKDDMPLQTYLIRYQKLLHDKAEKRFGQMLDHEAVHIDQLITDLEKDLEIKLQREKTNSVSLSNDMMNEIIKLSTIINSKEKNLMLKIDSVQESVQKSVQESVQESVTQSSNDLFNDLKQAFMNITHTIVHEALEPLMSQNERLDQKITDIQKNMTRKDPYDCSDLRKVGEQRSGVYLIYPQGEAVLVYCDMTTDGGGWTVFLKRHKQPIQENFNNKNWVDYRNGFGTPPNEYWLGNDILSLMTNQRDYAMRTDAVGPQTPGKVWGEYSHFQVANETSKYQLSISGRNAGDTMDIVKTGFSHYNHQHFSTYDNDNDKQKGVNCAQSYGGFWYVKCGYHLPTSSYKKMQFNYWSKVDKKLRYATEVEMKIRPRNWRE